jgi:hypothetical protein
MCEASKRRVGFRHVTELGHRHRRLLRGRRERPRRHRAAEKRNQLTSPHLRTQAQRDSIVSAKTSTLIGAEIGIKAIAAVHSQCR